MAALINAYSTHRAPPPFGFPHVLVNRGNRAEPDLLEHLDGFAGYVLSRGEREMTTSKYHVIQHIKRVQHHFSIEIEEDHLDAYSQWAWDSNAICFLPDGTIRDPAGVVLVDPQSGEPENGAEVPHPPDARLRMSQNDERLARMGIQVPPSLPPVVGGVEVLLQPAPQVARRSLALFVVALRGESLASESEVPADELRARFPGAFDALSPKELDFLNAASPERQQIVDAVWRYEAAWLLLWALHMVDDLPFPQRICDVAQLTSIMLEMDQSQFVAEATLRHSKHVLDSLDLHFRLHWAVRQAKVDGQDALSGLDAGVISERHYALNWLVRADDAGWDDVATPT